jgi:hypothetical protein
MTNLPLSIAVIGLSISMIILAILYQKISKRMFELYSDIDNLYKMTGEYVIKNTEMWKSHLNNEHDGNV